MKDGDIISIDCGVFYKGFHSDSAYTYPVGEISTETLSLLKATKESLYKGIEEAKFGNRIGDIAYAVQSYVEDRGYTVVRELVGHGLGRSLHEGPEVPNYGKRGKGPKLNEGLVIAIEPMSIWVLETLFKKVTDGRLGREIVSHQHILNIPLPSSQIEQKF